MARYGAFLSYSRRDIDFARKLHAALESYRIPKAAGASEATEKPDRIAPIFRDQDEVSASSNLDETLKQALRDSAALIIIASPDAAQSRWVNAEVEEFVRLGRAAKIFIAVPPYISSERDFQLNSVFPPALMGLGEPLAADFRKICDGWTLGKLKLVAGVAGIELVRLRDRDASRRLRAMATASIGAIAVLGIIGATGFNWLQAEQRAKAERVSRSVESIRTNLLSDQAGAALAFVDSIDRRDIAAEESAALDRIKLFWREQLQSPSDELLNVPAGSVYEINQIQYFRSQNGAMRMPVKDAQWVFQRKGSTQLYFSGADGAVTAVDSASGATTPVLPNPPGTFHPLNVYALPNNVTLVVGEDGGGSSQGAMHEVAIALYPDGTTSGVVQMRVFEEFHADAACTKLYFADGDKGYGAATPGSFNDQYAQALYSNPSTNDNHPFMLGVAALNPTAAWREDPASSIDLVNLAPEDAATDWLNARGPALREACAQYRFDMDGVVSSAVQISIPAMAAPTWRGDDAVSRYRQWVGMDGWSNRAGLPQGDPGEPVLFGAASGGVFAVIQYAMGAHSPQTGYHFCVQPNGGAAQCTKDEVDGALDPHYFPAAELLVSEDMAFDLRTMQRLSKPPALGSTEAPSGRVFMGLEGEGVTVTSFDRAAGAKQLRRYASADIEQPEALIALTDSDALVVTHEGHVVRVDTAANRVLWNARDRAIGEAIGGSRYVAPGVSGITLAASPNGTIGAVLTLTGVRLYDLVLGAPLTPFYRFDSAGARSVSQPSVRVSNEGAVTISGAGKDGVGFVRPAPKARPQETNPVCLYGARVVSGRAEPVDILGDANLRRECGFDKLAPAGD